MRGKLHNQDDQLDTSKKRKKLYFPTFSLFTLVHRIRCNEMSRATLFGEIYIYILMGLFLFLPRIIFVPHGNISILGDQES